MKRNKVFALVPVVGLSFALLTLSASPGHGYVSVPAAAFQPVAHSYEYANSGISVVNWDDTTQFWAAPVQLPQGATVTKMTFYWNDTDEGDDALVVLYRTPFTDTSDILAMAYSSGYGGFGDSEDTDIEHGVIDNSQYSYLLAAELPRTATRLNGVIIEYTYPVSLPLLVRNFQSRLGGR
jgi:hypothetical protein